MAPDSIKGSEGEKPLDQEQLDALLAKLSGEDPEQSEDEATLDEAALDALLDQTSEVTPQATVDSLFQEHRDEQAEDGIDQEAIDALITGDAGTAPEIAPEEDAGGPAKDGLDRAAIDALITGDSGTATDKVSQADAAGSEMLDQAALDALIVGQSVEPVDDSGETPLDQAALDALMAGTPEDVVVGDTGDEEDIQLDQAALDALVAEAGGGESAENIEQSAIDALIGAHQDDEVLDGSELDAVLGAEATVAMDVTGDEGADAGLDQLAIDALIADAGAGVPAPEDEETVEEIEALAKPAGLSDDVPLSQDIIDALVAAGGDEDEAARMVVSENMAAAAEGEGKEVAEGLLTQDALDALVQQAKEEKKKKKPVTFVPPPEETQPEPEAEAEAALAPAKPTKPRQPSVVAAFVRANPWRVLAAMTAGLLCTFGALSYLMSHQMSIPDMDALDVAMDSSLQRAIRSAKDHIDAGRYDEAQKTLKNVLAEAEYSPRRADGEFLLIEAQYSALPEKLTPDITGELYEAIDDAVSRSQAHPRVAQILAWKADMYVREGILHGASEVYDDIIENVGGAPNLDRVLYDAAIHALSIERLGPAAKYAKQLLQTFPGSPLAGPAKILLGDVYRQGGQISGARLMYGQVARAHADSALGAQAVERLGRLHFDQGQYNKAIDGLESRLAMATTLEGNDKIYLLLAKAYRASGNLAEADRVLRDLTAFFPETGVTPEALVVRSKILDELGKGRDAARLASQARRRFPKHAAVLRNEGEMLAKTGQLSEAARAFVAADEAGADDPYLLLEAGRYWRADGRLPKAHDVLKTLTKKYAAAPEAFEGSIQLAEVLYGMGRAQKAVDRLEDLATVSLGKPQRLPVLISLAKIYEDLGLRQAVIDRYSEIAASTSEPEMLARAATVLLEIGEPERGRDIAKNLDTSKLRAPTAYRLLLAQGDVQLMSDVRKGLEKLEQAYVDYPAERTAVGDAKLLRAYLSTGRSARARALVMELASHVRQNPLDTPRLEQAANAWGDFLYGRNDFRAAADAYDLTLAASKGDNERIKWAMYQRANALLKLNDFQGSVGLYDSLKDSKAQWSEDAGLKAKYARLEQKLRGLDVTEMP